MKMLYGLLVGALLMMTGPAWAVDCTPGTVGSINPACQGGTTITNTFKPTNTNTLSQDQNQNNGQQIAPHQSVKFEDVRQSPAVLAPALTSAGQNVCLGSFSLGVSVYGAGASFGKTVVDAGCERRNNAALLYQFGRPDAALRLMMLNDEVRAALNPTEQDTKRASMGILERTKLKLIEAESATVVSVPSATESAVTCKITETKVRAGNDEWFCRAQP